MQIWTWRKEKQSAGLLFPGGAVSPCPRVPVAGPGRWGAGLLPQPLLRGSEERGSGRRGTGGRRWRKSEKGEKEAKPESLPLHSSVPLCCSPRREQGETLPGETWGRNVCAERGPGEAQACEESVRLHREKRQGREREARRAESIFKNK